MKKIKIISTLLATTCICGGFLFLNTKSTSTTVTTAPIVEEEHLNNETSQNKEVTSDNYKDALEKYINEHPEKVNSQNPTEVLNSFMVENNLDYIETSNY